MSGMPHHLFVSKQNIHLTFTLCDGKSISLKIWKKGKYKNCIKKHNALFFFNKLLYKQINSID